LNFSLKTPLLGKTSDTHFLHARRLYHKARQEYVVFFCELSGMMRHAHVRVLSGPIQSLSGLGPGHRPVSVVGVSL
jgi:hypothetical protein